MTDNRTDAEKYTPEFNQIEKNHGEATTEEEIKGALKEESVPENTEVTVKNPESLLFQGSMKAFLKRRERDRYP